jgi:hypothetical protein
MKPRSWRQRVLPRHQQTPHYTALGPRRQYPVKIPAVWNRYVTIRPTRMEIRPRDRITGTESLSHGKELAVTRSQHLTIDVNAQKVRCTVVRKQISYVKGRKAKRINFPIFFLAFRFIPFTLFFLCNVQCSLFEARRSPSIFSISYCIRATVS